MTKPLKDRLPITAYANASGVTLPGVPAAVGGTATGRVLRQYERFDVTPELYAETLDRNGNSFFDLDEPAQVARYGRVLWIEGEPPEGAIIGADDEGLQYRAGTRAREEALLVSDPKERAAAVAEVERQYGSALRPVAQGPQSLPRR